LRQLIVIAGSVALFAVADSGAVRAQSVAPQLHVVSCTVASIPHRAVMEVEFRNDTSKELTSIVWRARYGSGWIDFTDKADVLPGATIKHTLWDTARVSRLAMQVEDSYRSGPENCSVLATQAKSGATWRDERADPAPQRIPTPEPDDARPVPATIDNPLQDPIGIVGCKLIVAHGRTRGLGRKAGRGVLSVRFRNLSDKPIDRIVFRAAYGAGGFDFIFGGVFSPNVLVSSDQYVLGEKTGKLFRDLPVDTPVDYVSLDEPANCTTVSVRYIGGRLWQNPMVGPTEPPLPIHEPSR
jgi:hypothetical protein